MELYLEAPDGWLELRLRMDRAKTPEEVDNILKEMAMALDAYEVKIGSRRCSPPRRDSSEDQRALNE